MQYLSFKAYPVGSTKAEKTVIIIRKRAKRFELVAGVLHYRDQVKSDGRQFLRQVLLQLCVIIIIILAIQ